MSTYYTNEAAFDLPDLGFTDVTTHVLAVKLDDGPMPSLLVSRNPLPEGKTLAEAVEESLKRATIALRAHKVIGRREITVGGAPAVEVAAAWTDAQGEAVYTRQVHLVVGETWMVLAVNGAAAERERCDAVIEEAEATFRLRE
jgi:hypothetical protein